MTDYDDEDEEPPADPDTPPPDPEHCLICGRQRTVAQTERGGWGKWHSIKDSKAGWFFQNDGTTYCPEHVPEWVPAWRARQAAKREAAE